MTIKGNGSIAVIPARSGSKRLRNKNTSLLLGKPLIQWVIEAAKGSKFLDKDIYVSTDSDRIGLIAEKCGAGFIKRPDELATDDVWTEPVIQHAVERVEKKRNMRFQYVIWLNASIPQIKSDDIDRAVEKLMEFNLREVFSVDQELLGNSAVRVLMRDALDQRSLSVNCGFIQLPYIDIHYQSDLDAVAKKMER